MALAQMIFILAFILNLSLLWLSVLQAKFSWYRFPGYILLLIIPLAMVFPGQPVFELDYFWWRIAGVLAIIAGLAVNLWAIIEMQKNGAKWHDTSPKALVVTGPYQFVRHPISLGLVFILVGWWWVWAAAYAFYFGMAIVALIWLHAYLEEKLVLGKMFGDKYRDYKQRTGMFWVK